jgi:serine/threonine protein phosphatase PrpC
MHPEYLVLATDGVWDFLKPQQIRQVISNNKKLNA